MPNLTLETFVDKLLDEKFPGVAIPTDRRDKMKQELLPRLNKMIMLKMLQALSPEDLTKFQNLAQGNETNEQLQKFLAERIPNQDAFIAGILGEFRELYLGPAK